MNEPAVVVLFEHDRITVDGCTINISKVPTLANGAGIKVHSQDVFTFLRGEDDTSKAQRTRRIRHLVRTLHQTFTINESVCVRVVGIEGKRVSLALEGHNAYVVIPHSRRDIGQYVPSHVVPPTISASQDQTAPTLPTEHETDVPPVPEKKKTFLGKLFGRTD